MFGIGGNKVLELQIKAAEAEAMDIINDAEESPGSRATMLRQLLQIKERAARFVLEELESMVALFTAKGVSSVSLVAIAEAYRQAIEAATSQMQVFANRLAELTHNADLEECYSYISESLSNHAEEIIKPLKESKEKALEDVDSMAFAEYYETWRNLESKPI